MSLYGTPERRFLTAVAALTYANPFLPERVQLERQALGDEFESGEPVWSVSVADPNAPRPNVWHIYDKLVPLVDQVHQRLQKSADVNEKDLETYQDCVLHVLYQRYYAQFVAAAGEWRFYREFLADWNRYYAVAGKRIGQTLQPEHAFACFRQIQRAFHHIFDNIIGSSIPAARLRASVWESIFTHDMRRYRGALHARMADFPTLITGPSGTGKELVARAIAGSRYVPFDAGRMEFLDAPGEPFFPINVAALSPALIESELFGHRRGAFTGAIADRRGWLEACPPLGTVFLDELGEMELSIQVKLLRVIETRRFSAVGDTAVREFHGKLIAATNRDLAREIREGRFREDLYYRLCADLIRTPTLREQIEDSPEVLRGLILHMLRRVLGQEAESCRQEVEEWIARNLPEDYAWPGNYRELEQCVRNIVIRRSYQPIAGAVVTPEESFLERFRAGRLKAGEVLAYYAAQVYLETGSYEETARRLDLDRRTVKAKVAEHLAKDRE